MTEKTGVIQKSFESIYERISLLLDSARSKTLSFVNATMVHTYYEIGRIIFEEEQNGKERAEYGKETLKNLSARLTASYGKGFSVENLDRMRYFYKTYSKSSTVLTNSEELLSWSHYLFLMRIDNPEERAFYEKEAYNSHWSLREMKRQFNSALYERLSLSKDKEEIRKMAGQGLIIEKPQDIVKDPYVLEFLGLTEKASYTESELEQKLIDKLQAFLLELGRGFTYVGRQVRLTFNEKHFYVDAAFYNRILQCFVLVDFKTGEITPQDIGQMQMYVHYYDRYVKLENENKTVGIILCKDKDDALVEITLPEDNTQIFASKYLTILPDKKELEILITNDVT